MARIKRQHNRYWAGVRIPKDLRSRYDGKEHLWRNLQTSDVKVAKAEADAWEALLRLEWSTLGNPAESDERTLRRVYQETRKQAAAGEFVVLMDDDEDPAVIGIGFEAEKIAEAAEGRELEPPEEAKLAGLLDAVSDLKGRPKATPAAYEAPFSEVADDYIKAWKRTAGLKPSNTEAQKKSTFALFKGFWKDRPIREVREKDGAAFYDALKQLSPLWARTEASKGLPWDALMRNYGNHPTGLSPATINRHMATLRALWTWARKRGHCAGDNPFDGFHEKLTAKNVKGYLPWEDAELKKLFSPAPKRRDLHEVMAVAIYSGLRLNEIAALTWEQLEQRDGIDLIRVEDAKTPAGNREVPLHPALSWLTARKDGNASGRIWTTFNEEGPGEKPGADAGREFSRFKTARGFTNRRKTFHSFRKNVTKIMENARVPENEWALIVGHERGFTYGTYNPDGITLARKAEIIGLIDYPELDLSRLQGPEKDT